MDELNLDLIGLQSEEEFHDRAAATFDFPHYYGRNRDAFWDYIRGGLGVQPRSATGSKQGSCVEC